MFDSPSRGGPTLPRNFFHAWLTATRSVEKRGFALFTAFRVFAVRIDNHGFERLSVTFLSSASGPPLSDLHHADASALDFGAICYLRDRGGSG